MSALRKTDRRLGLATVVVGVLAVFVVLSAISHDGASILREGSTGQVRGMTSPIFHQPMERHESATNGGVRSKDVRVGSALDVDFERDVRPILRQRCVTCHGPDEAESGLRLDAVNFAMDGGDRGVVIVPGEPENSRLYRVVADLDDEVEQMPPDGEGTPLNDDELEIIRNWIAEGARWPEGDVGAIESDHWAFQPIARPVTPTVTESSWSGNAIDAFILAHLESQSIRPSPRASREVLIRRLYLDLLGIPPSIDEVDRFLDDRAPDAYEQLVDRLLASPHFGERWGRHWLDVARYADTDGYEKDLARPNAWRYRDWVIAALNDDMAFDEFSIRQIAGDMIDGRSVDTMAATGFHRNTLHNTEGGTDAEEDRFKKTVDRTNTIGTIWLGLTIGCAQCHSHKYDPISHRDYYALFAYFNQMDEATSVSPRNFDLASYERQLAFHESRVRILDESIAQYEANRVLDAQREWESNSATTLTRWRSATVTSFESIHGAVATISDDGTILVAGPNIGSDLYRVCIQTGSEPVTAIRLETLPDSELPHLGPGRADNGNFVLAEFGVVAGADWQAQDIVKPMAARSDFSQGNWEVAKSINDQTGDGWAISPQVGQRHVAVFDLHEPLTPQDGIVTVILDQSYPNNPHNLGSFRISVTSSAAPAQLESAPVELHDALATPLTERTGSQDALISEYYIGHVDVELKELRRQLATELERRPSTNDFVARSVRQRDTPRTTYVHLRGDFLRPDQEVAPRLPGLFDAWSPNVIPVDRLELARSFFDADHPLTSRVTANRIWTRIFGQGLVTTVDDFGLQGQSPSHPQLLDWLATFLQENEWSVKALIREIVCSETYRQSSTFRDELVDIDPQNVFLARQNRRRVEAEIIRDLALGVSGLLERQLGGPSVRPPQPLGYSDLTYANSAKWETSQGGDAYRRGVYTFFQRTSPYPMLTIFDCPDSNQSAAARSSSNTVIQSITLWNDVVFFESARALASRTVEEVALSSSTIESSSVDELIKRRVVFAFRCCMARSPTESEIAILERVYRTQVDLINQTPGSADAIVEGMTIPDGVSKNELASWTLLTRVILNLDEFIMNE